MITPRSIPSADNQQIGHRQLFLPGDSFVHRLDPEIKIAVAFLFVVAAALLPRTQLLPVLANGGALAAVVVVARLPPLTLLIRLTVIGPFVAFSLFIPFVGGGQTTEVAGVALSVEGLWASWGILSKAILGAGASIVLSSTTSIPQLLRGLSVLRVPAVVVAIIAFMFRYLDLITGQVHRMRNAMISRAHDPRWLWQAKPIASSAGALFVRTYERGERTHLAMVSRGYTGSMPCLDSGGGRQQGIKIASALAASTPAVLAWINLLIASGFGPVQ